MNKKRTSILPFKLEQPWIVSNGEDSRRMLPRSKQVRGDASLLSPELDRTVKRIHGTTIYFAHLGDEMSVSR